MNTTFRRFAGIGVLVFAPGLASAADWMVRVQTTSRVCHIQVKTAAPLGVDLLGPFSTRKAACDAAAKAFDSTATDQSKCSAYGGGTEKGCKVDGVTLPK